jgi:hypothetical protein
MKKIEPMIFKTYAWKRFMQETDNYSSPYQVYPTHTKQTKYEKKMARLMKKMIDYEWAQMKCSTILKTPFGVLVWSPKHGK